MANPAGRTFMTQAQPFTTTPVVDRTRLRRLLSIATSTLFAFTLVALACEGYFRLRYAPSYVPDPGIQADRVLGWDSIPPVAPLPLNAGHDNAVLFLGDSFTDRKEWPTEAQRQLGAAGVAIDGYNLGVTGFGTAQEFLKLQQHAARVAPGAIVVLFFAWNDLRDNYAYPELFYGPQRTSRPYLRLSNGAVSVSPVDWTSELGASFLRSELYLRVFNRLRLRFDTAIVRRWPDLPSDIGWHAKIYYEDPVSWHPFYQASRAESPYVKGAYDATIAAFKGIRDLAAKTSAPLLVIGIDNAFTVDRDVFEHYVEPFPDLDPSLPLKRIAQLLEHEHIAFVNAQPELAALGSQTGKPIYNGPAGGLGLAGHLQPEADRLVGVIAARWLGDRLSRR
jgi:hypothetical protein